MAREPQLPTPDGLIAFLDRWKTRKIVVAGDFMLDRYVYGNAERLSPDAPVPVLAVDRTTHAAGGASNVCLDLRALRCDVHALGVVGADSAADELLESLAAKGVDAAALVTVADRPTTVKQNFVGLAQHRHPQKMFRVDIEKKGPIDEATEHALLTHARRLLKGADALCIEDYNKGVLTPRFCQALIKLARRMKVPVLVDPAAISDYSKYKGVTTITPNRTEAARATGFTETADRESIDAIARKLTRDLNLTACVLTLDKQGALLLEKGKGKHPVLLPTVARQVYDVTGAGDMVLAMLAASIANGADWLTAVALANVAAGLEVEKFGVVPIELDEVLVFLLQQKNLQAGKLRSIDQLVPELAALRRQGRKIAFTNGCFDILHAGHVSYLREARRAGDLLVVGLNTDASIRRIKGEGRPVNHEDDRVMVLGELESVDYVVLFDDDTPMKLIEAIRPESLVKGADYKKKDVVGAEYVEASGGKVVLVPLVKGRSTTNIIRKISGK